MGWGNCGTDSKGRPIGYAYPAHCDHPSCKAKIDRGLSYACGGMHGDDTGCEGYFCEKHLFRVEDPDKRLRSPMLCQECKNSWNECMVDELTEKLRAAESEKDRIIHLDNGILRERRIEIDRLRDVCDEAREALQGWVDRQGHDRCWYYPDVFDRLARIFHVEQTRPSALPDEAEFEEGCRKFRDAEYGESRTENRISSTD